MARICIIETSAPVGRMLQQRLKSWPMFHHVRTFQQHRAAEHDLREQLLPPFDLFLVDFDLPDAVPFVAFLRLTEPYKEVPIVLRSSTDPQRVHLGSTNACIAKVLPISTLIARIPEFLAMSPAQTDETRGSPDEV